MSPTAIADPAATEPTARTETLRRRSIGFLNWAHLLDHFVMLIFPTVVIGLEAVYGRSYGDLLSLSTASFVAFGLFALPSGWLAERFGRRTMIAVFFLGTGVSSIAVGFAPNFTMLAVALFAVGVFAAIYHPVGTPMVVDLAINRGHTMSWNGVWGNVGVSVAAAVTAALTAWINWRWAFFVPGAIFIVTGLAYLALTPPEVQRKAGVAHAQDVVLDRRMAMIVISMFLTLSISSGLVFNAVTVSVPKIIDSRLHEGVSLTIVGFLATAVFLCGALAQLTVGRLVDRTTPHVLISGVALMQLLGIVWVTYATGWPLLIALAVTVAAMYGQVTLNDIVLARYTPIAWRYRVYAIRFFITFTLAGPAVWGIGHLYDVGGFALVLPVIVGLATLYFVNSAAISVVVAGVERERAVAPAE